MRMKAVIVMGISVFLMMMIAEASLRPVSKDRDRSLENVRGALRLETGLSRPPPVPFELGNTAKMRWSLGTAHTLYKEEFGLEPCTDQQRESVIWIAIALYGNGARPNE